MTSAEILAFAKRELEPSNDAIGHTIYRCAAYLTDGVYLPCVAIRSKRDWLELALKRLEETRRDVEEAGILRRGQARKNYESLVETFVAAGNRVNDYDIARLERSRFAIPARLLATIPGETSMSWTQFVATMRDGRRFSFATACHTDFFAMPDGYSGGDVTTIDAHAREHEQLLRERPFFTCLIDGYHSSRGAAPSEEPRGPRGPRGTEEP